MISHHNPYRVYFHNPGRDVCTVEAEAPIDPAHLRAYIARTRQVFALADDVEMRVIEIQQVTERRDITCEILGDTSRPDRMDIIRRILDEHNRGEMIPMDAYREARELFDFDKLESNEEQTG